MKTARPLVLALLSTLASLVTVALPAAAQFVPDVPVSPRPTSAPLALEQSVTWSAGGQVVLLPAPTGGPLGPVLPVWLPALQRPSSQAWHAAPRNATAQRAVRESGRTGRPMVR